MLPPELLRAYIAPEQKFVELPAAELSPPMIERLYRDGVGVSFHEFCLALSLSEFDVLADGDSNPKQSWYIPSPAYEQALRQVLVEYKEPMPAGFSRPSLDFVLKKK